MTAYQICVRCENRWPVTYQARQWCPGCRGVLLSPVAADGSVPPTRRNFRWVARPPGGATTGDRRPRRPARTATPRYDEIPRWGLTDVVIPDDDEPRRTETMADLAPTLLVGTAVVFGLAAIAEAVRYGLLLYNRARLVDPLVLAVSDAAVWATQVCAPFVALATAIASALRLIEVRRRVYADRGETDPRSPRSLLAGFVVPGLNLAMPGVYLTEIAGDHPRLPKAIRTWWVLWVLDAILVVTLALWRQRDTLQARADGVVLAAIVAATAAAVALAALRVVRLFDGADVWGRPLHPARFTPSTGPAVPVIAPIVPAAAASQVDKEENASLAKSDETDDSPDNEDATAPGDEKVAT